MTHISPSPALLYQRFAEVRIASAGQKRKAGPCAVLLVDGKGYTGLVLWRRRQRWTSLACPVPTRRLAAVRTSRSPTASGCSRSRWAGPGGLPMSARAGSPGLSCQPAYTTDLEAPQLFTGSWGAASAADAVPEICSTGRPWGRRQPGLASRAHDVQSRVVVARICIAKQCGPTWQLRGYQRSALDFAKSTALPRAS